jgi:iron complex outermembrane receptor protein
MDFREENFRVSADMGFQKHRIDGGQPSITFAAGVPILDAPDADESIGQPWTYSDSNDVFGTLRAEYDFADNITGWAAVGARRSEEDSIFANPTVNDTDGNYSTYRFETAREDSILTGETGVRFNFQTGAVGHELTVSGATYELESDNAFDYSAFGGFTGNIYSPTDQAIPPLLGNVNGGNLDDPTRTIKTRFQSIAVADQLSMLEDRLLVTLGARYQSLKDYAYDYESGARLDSSYDEDAVTPTLGVLYKLTPSLSAYANYIEGLQKGERVGSSFTSAGAANTGEVLDPYETQQSEVGLKYDDGNLGGSVSVYRSEKPVAGLNDANVYEVLYDQENTGVELMAYGNATRNLTVLGGVSFLDADVDGNDAIGSPDSQRAEGGQLDPSGPGRALPDRPRRQPVPDPAWPGGERYRRRLLGLRRRLPGRRLPDPRRTAYGAGVSDPGLLIRQANQQRQLRRPGLTPGRPGSQTCSRAPSAPGRRYTNGPA